MNQAILRIGELSRRTGLSPELLRAWERRYGVLSPERTSGGFRLYSAADEARVHRMRALIDGGLSAAQAARLTRGETLTTARSGDGASEELARELDLAVLSYDEGRVQQALDDVLGRLSVEAALEEVILPALRRLGEQWAAGEVSVAQEHFVSNLLRARLTGIARGWERGSGPLAMLACPPGEMHDLALIAFGVVLHRLGWRVTYLGQDTPVEQLHAVAAATHPRMIVVAATLPEHFTAVRVALARLAQTAPLAIAGPGATADLAQEIGARLLGGSPLEAARSLAA